MYGCIQYHNKAGGGDRINSANFDSEQGNNAKHSGPNQERDIRQTAGFWGYLFQIIFQVN